MCLIWCNWWHSFSTVLFYHVQFFPFIPCPVLSFFSVSSVVLSCPASSCARDRSFFMREGGGAGGIWETPFKNRMTPLQLTNFFTWPPLRAVIFFNDPPPPLPQDFTFLIFSIIPILDVIVLIMKTKFTIPILQGALQLKKKTNQKKEKLNQLYILYSNTVCFSLYQGITIHTTVASVTF